MAGYKSYETKKGIRWRGRAYLRRDNNKDIRIQKQGFKTKKEAKLYIERALADYNNNNFLPNDHISFGFVYEQWLNAYTNSGVKDSSITSTIGLYKNHILPELNDLPISKITVDKCQELTNMWFKKFKMYRKLINLMNQIFEYAIKKQVITFNPVSLVDIPVNRSIKTEREIYSMSELKYFLDILGIVASEKQQMYFTLLAETGLRKSEALAITWNDINFGNKTLTINKTVSKSLDNHLVLDTPKTKSSNRIIDIADNTLMRLLKNWKLKQKELLTYFNITIIDDSQLIFTTDTNQIHQPSAPNEWIKSIYVKHDNLIKELLDPTPSEKALKLKNIIEKHSFKLRPIKRLTLHEFRHTHCTLLFEAGVGIEDVKQRLGHSKIATTIEIYDHYNKKRATQVSINYYNYKESVN